MELKDLIRLQRQRLNLSQEDLGRMCGVTRQAVADWENGRAAPKRKRAKRVADALGLELAQIDPLAISNVSDSGRAKSRSAGYTGFSTTDEGRTIPLISLEQIGEHVAMLQEAVRIFVDMAVPIDAQAFTVSDDSMAPVYNVGDVIIVSPSIRPRDGDDVVAKIDGVNVFRQYRPRGEAFDLVPLSPEYSTTTVRRHPSDVTLYVMVEHRRKRAR